MVYFNPFLNLISPNYKYIKSLQQLLFIALKFLVYSKNNKYIFLIND